MWWTAAAQMVGSAARTPSSSGAHGDISVGGPIYFGDTGNADNSTLLIAGVAILALIYLVK